MDTVLRKGNWFIISLMLSVGGLGETATAQVYNDPLHLQRYQEDVHTAVAGIGYIPISMNMLHRDRRHSTRAEVLTIPWWYTCTSLEMYYPKKVLPT